MGKAFARIKSGLNEAVRHARGARTAVRVHTPEPVDIKALRERVGMTQGEFAATFGISLGTLRHWERGARRPHGPAAVLLLVIAKNHKAVLRALS